MDQKCARRRRPLQKLLGKSLKVPCSLIRLQLFLSDNSFNTFPFHFRWTMYYSRINVTSKQWLWQQTSSCAEGCVSLEDGWWDACLKSVKNWAFSSSLCFWSFLALLSWLKCYLWKITNPTFSMKITGNTALSGLSLSPSEIFFQTFIFQI